MSSCILKRTIFYWIHTFGGRSSAVTTQISVPYPTFPRNRNPTTETRGNQPRGGRSGASMFPPGASTGFPSEA